MAFWARNHLTGVRAGGFRGHTDSVRRWLIISGCAGKSDFSAFGGGGWGGGWEPPPPPPANPTATHTLDLTKHACPRQPATIEQRGHRPAQTPRSSAPHMLLRLAALVQRGRHCRKAASLGPRFTGMHSAGAIDWVHRPATCAYSPLLCAIFSSRKSTMGIRRLPDLLRHPYKQDLPHLVIGSYWHERELAFYGALRRR